MLSLVFSGCDPIFSDSTEGVEVLWTQPLGGDEGEGLVMPAVGDDAVYFAIEAGVTRLDRATGVQLWFSERHDQPPANLILRDGRIYGAGLFLTAWDVAAGAELWRIALEETATFGDIAMDEHVYVGTDGGFVHAFAPNTGNLVWHVQLEPTWQQRVVSRGVSATDEAVYISVERWLDNRLGQTREGWVFALDADTGEELWRYKNMGPGPRRNIHGPVTVTEDLLLASDLWSNSFFAIDRRTGQEVWRVIGDRGWVGPHRAPFVDGEYAYVGGDRNVYKVVVATGEVVWKTDVGGSMDQAVVCGDHILANASDIVVLDPETGEITQRLLESYPFPSGYIAVDGDQAFLTVHEAFMALSC